MSWMKRLLSALFRLFRPRPPIQEKLPPPVARIWGRWVKPEPERHIYRSGLPNAPSRQPCQCFSWVKRTKKLATRAEYYCSRCQLTIIESLR